MPGRKGRSGPRPKPTVLHKLEGTYRPDRHRKRRAQEPMPEGALKEPPQSLTADEQAEWQYVIRHAPIGLLTKLDRDLLVLWCQATVQSWRAETLNELVKAGNLMLRVSDRLGFSPAARPQIKIDPPTTRPEVVPDPWAELRHFPVFSGAKK